MKNPEEGGPVMMAPSGRRLSRRELLGHGVIGFSAVATLPGILGLGARAAAAGCGAKAYAEGLPFLAFDMAGGAALPGNFLVRGASGDLLPSYSRLGWEPRAAGALFDGFGIPMARTYSRLLAGILAHASADAQARLRMGGICHFAQDDSSSNQMNAAPLVLRAGAYGQVQSNGLCIRKSASGGNSAGVITDLALQPTSIASIEDALGSAVVAGAGLARLSREQVLGVLQGARRLGALQGTALRGSQDGELLADLAACAYDKSLELLDLTAALDPRLDPAARAAYGIEAGSSGASREAVAAAVAMNSIKGLSGPGVWTLGGCDYHDGTQTSGDAKDFEMGAQIGRAVELAHRLGRPLFFQLLTDGGCDAVEGSRAWRSDAGDKCMTVCGFYRPAGAPEMRRQQVGHYTAGQGAERATLVGGSPSLVGYAVLANYLACSGKLSRFHDLAPGVFTGAGELDSVLLFEEHPS